MWFFAKKKQHGPASALHPPKLRALLFDTFGTTVDWLGSMLVHARQIGTEAGVKADWDGLVREWRARYKPAIQPVREGTRQWADFDRLHREELDKIADRFGASRLSSLSRDRLTQGWHHLGAWPDAAPALHRLRKEFLLAPLSNGTVRQLIDIARYAHLPWDTVFGADLFRTYKPAEALYRGALDYLGVLPAEAMMVAAHNEDLQAAQKMGMRTCFVHRATEDLALKGTFDYVVDDFEHLARALGAV